MGYIELVLFFFLCLAMGMTCYIEDEERRRLSLIFDTFTVIVNGGANLPLSISNFSKAFTFEAERLGAFFIGSLGNDSQRKLLR